MRLHTRNCLDDRNILSHDFHEEVDATILTEQFSKEDAVMFTHLQEMLGHDAQPVKICKACDVVEFATKKKVYALIS